MAVNTVLIDFSVDAAAVHEETAARTLVDHIETVLRAYLTDLRPLYTRVLGASATEAATTSSRLHLYESDLASLVMIRIYTTGLITINLEYYKADDGKALISYDHTKEVEERVCAAVRARRSKMLPPVRRGAAIDVYLTSSDERLLEYDIDKVVFEERTTYQKVQIVHSKSLGNMLVLDDLQNISESDLIYTETLMMRGREDYKGKEVCILGGGDGALLYELLKEQPAHVVMLEIDDVVMSACAKHMRSICGDVLDAYTGPHYEIIVGDCMKTLDEFIAAGRKFDYVFGDLTDIPISMDRENMNAKVWDFILKILELSFKILKKDGKFMTHGNGTSCEESLRLYEEQLKKLQPPVVINRSKAFVPSFLEDWVFYQITFADAN